MRPLTLVVVLLVLTAGCTTPTQSMAERLAQVEGRVAQLEAGITGPAANPAADAASGEDQATADAGPSEKEQFAQAVARDQLDDRLADVAGIAEIREIRLDDATDTLIVDAAAAEDAGEAAWQAAQELAGLWSDLSDYQPVLDLRVGAVRCACSARLMKAVASGAADRAAWEVACQTA